MCQFIDENSGQPFQIPDSCGDLLEWAATTLDLSKLDDGCAVDIRCWFRRITVEYENMLNEGLTIFTSNLDEIRHRDKAQVFEASITLFHRALIYHADNNTCFLIPDLKWAKNADQHNVVTAERVAILAARLYWLGMRL